METSAPERLTPEELWRYHYHTFTLDEALKEAVGKEEFFVIRNVEITPEAAQDVLDNRRLNRERPLNERAWKKLARSMAASKFYPHLHTLKFGVDQMEYDGQHRFRSIVAVGRPQVVSVMFNVPFNAHGHIDTMRARRLGNELAFRDYDNTDALTRLSTWAFAWENGDKTYGPHLQPTVEEVTAMLEADSSLAESVAIAALFKGDRLATPAALAFTYWVIMRDSKAPHKEEQVRLFFNDLHKGAGLAEDDPVLTLRDRLRKEYGEKAPQLRRSHNQAHMILQAWNHRRRGQSVTFLRVPRVKTDLPTPL